MVKSSNHIMNAETPMDLVDLEAAGHSIGSTTDNAAVAIKEGRDTFDLVMDACIKSDDPEIRALSMVNGVRRCPSVFGDGFHWANLAGMHTSKGFSGDTENGKW